MINVALSNAMKNERAVRAKSITREFQQIRDQLIPESTVYVDGDREVLGGANIALDYFLAGCIYSSEENATYVVSPNRAYNTLRLTSNAGVNLFAREERMTQGQAKSTSGQREGEEQAMRPPAGRR